MTNFTNYFNGWNPDNNGQDYSEKEPLGVMLITKNNKIFRIVNKNNSHTSITKFLKYNPEYIKLFLTTSIERTVENNFITITWKDVILTMNMENYRYYLEFLINNN